MTTATPDVIFHNGHITTLDRSRPRASAASSATMRSSSPVAARSSSNPSPRLTIARGSSAAVSSRSRRSVSSAS